MVATAKRYRVKLTMPACVSIERRRVLEAFGAELILTPPGEGTDGAIRLAHKILSEDPGKYFMPNQFDSERTSWPTMRQGKEIIEQTNGRVTHFVARWAGHLWA
jgi:cysteine synthase B